MNYMVKKIFTSITITVIMVPCLTGCTQSSHIFNAKDIKSNLVLIVMPEQKCPEKNMGRILVEEKTFHPAHKECYYKY